MGGCCVNVGCSTCNTLWNESLLNGDILIFCEVLSKFLIQAAHVTSPHNNSPPFQGIRNATDRVSGFAPLTVQNRELV